MEKKLSLGMRVRCLDGEAGPLVKIVADPKTHRPGYLVVRRGRIAKRDIVVPVDLVAETGEGSITVDTTRKALDSFPDYEVTVEKAEPKNDGTLYEPFIPPLMQAWKTEGTMKVRERTVPEHTVAIHKGMTVFDHLGTRLGRVTGIIADARTRQASHLVLHRPGTPRDEHRMLPVDLVDFVIRSHLYLRITKELVPGLTLYQPEKAHAEATGE